MKLYKRPSGIWYADYLIKDKRYRTSLKTKNKKIAAEIAEVMYQDDLREVFGLHGSLLHTLRHSFSSALVSDGVDIVTVKAILGHQNIVTTQIYSHSNMELMRSAIDNCAIIVPKKSEENIKKLQQVNLKRLS